MRLSLNEAILKGTSVSVDMDEASPDVCRELKSSIKHSDQAFCVCLFLSLTALQERLGRIKYSDRLETPEDKDFIL